MQRLVGFADVTVRLDIEITGDYDAADFQNDLTEGRLWIDSTSGRHALMLTPDYDDSAASQIGWLAIEYDMDPDKPAMEDFDEIHFVPTPVPTRKKK